MIGFGQRFREWEPNPILLKELRQAMHSRIFIGMLMTLLVALLLVATALAAGQGITEIRGWLVGQSMFNAFLIVLAVISLVFIPLYTGVRLAAERHRLDLMFYTLVSDAKIVRGKLSSGVYLSVLFFSVCMPFMTFSSLFGGVDLPTVSFVLAVLFTAVCVAILAAVAIGSMPLYLFPKAFVGLVFTIALVVGCGFLLFFFFGVVRSGVGMLMHSGHFWSGFIPALIIATLVAFWLYAIAVSAITVVRHPGRYSSTNTPISPQPSEITP